MEFLLDFNIPIDRFNRVIEARRYLAGIRGRSAISVVTRAEILVGFGTSYLRTATRFLGYFPLLEIIGAIADLAAGLRREYGWKLPDAFQAALTPQALHKNRICTKITGGRKS